MINKTISIIDDHCKRFISLSPLLFLSTCDRDGTCDVSPRGGKPGFVHVVDHKHLLIPERPGNRRIDSMRNIISNPHVGLIFLIPGQSWVLRINGNAGVIKTSDVLDERQVGTGLTELSIAVEVKECFIHCPNALNTSKVWETDTWRSKEDMPSPDQMFRAHLTINGFKLEE